jgi:nitrite reductase/ring-hydroxylating ferredoxin subunit
LSKQLLVASTRHFEEGTINRYEVAGEDILIAKVGGKFYAVQSRCPHFGGDLSRGKLEGAVITCPRHGSQFNLTDGSVIRWLSGGVVSAIGKAVKPPQTLKVYQVSVKGQDILLNIEQ